MSNLKAALDMLRQTFRYCSMPTLCAASCVGILVGLPAFARVAEKVVVRGAQFIPEDDIRMTCGAEAGVDYSALEIQAIEDCLMSTGVFESASLSQQGDTLYIDVQELNTRPGRVDASLAYVAQDGITGSLAFERYNLFERTYGMLRLEYGDQIQRVDASLYRTEAFDSAVDVGFDISAGKLDYDDRSYTERLLRAETYVAWAPSAMSRLEGGIGYRFHSLEHLDSTASALLVRERTSGISAPYIRIGLDYATATPSEAASQGWQSLGYSVELDQYFWNIGSSDPISWTRIGAGLQIPIAPEFRLLLNARAGRVYGMDGNATRAIDRFFPGADTFRGFAPRGIGPRDAGDALGGNEYATASVELQHDFGRFRNSPILGGIFLDTGATWGLNDTLGGTIDDSFHQRSSVGVSLTFEVAQTPISLYLAHAFDKEPGDELQAFGLSMSTRF